MSDLTREKTEIPCPGGGRPIRTTYGDVARKSSIKSSKGHEYKSSIGERTGINKTGCNKCTGSSKPAFRLLTELQYVFPNVGMHAELHKRYELLDFSKLFLRMVLILLLIV